MSPVRVTGRAGHEPEGGRRVAVRRRPPREPPVTGPRTGHGGGPPWLSRFPAADPTTGSSAATVIGRPSLVAMTVTGFTGERGASTMITNREFAMTNPSSLAWRERRGTGSGSAEWRAGELAGWRVGAVTWRTCKSDRERQSPVRVTMRPGVTRASDHGACAPPLRVAAWLHLTRTGGRAACVTRAGGRPPLPHPYR